MEYACESLPDLVSAIEIASIDAIITIDNRGIVQTFNPAAQRLFGYSRDETVGQNVKMLMPGHYREQHDSYVSNYLRTGEKKIIGTGRLVAGLRKDGSSFPMELSVGEAVVRGERVFVGVIRDLTQIQNASRRAETLQSELFHVSRLSEMGQVAANLAHEVSQPLAAIVNYAQAGRHLLGRDQLDASSSVAGLLEKIEAQAARASDISKRLRSFVERREVPRRPEGLHASIEEALALAIVGARNQRVRILLKLSSESARVNIDRIQIQQVLVNLVRNAADAMEGLTESEITIASAIEEGERVRVTVSDVGPGVDPAVVDRLFGPFVTTKGQGMGIGLSICKSIVESHGGEIGFEPNVPRGVSFHFTLPLFADPS
jgi:two-component system sensor kinase FixL